MNYKIIHEKLIISAGGKIEDGIVLEPGVALLAKTELSQKGKEIFEKLNVYSIPDFNSKITYMNFVDKNLENIVSNLGHLSIYNDTYITFLIAGISLEAELELVAHNEAKIARLTSSRTKAQLEPLFVIPEAYKNNVINFKKYINEILKIRNTLFESPNNKDELEAYNNLPYKAVSLTMSMSLKDWHKTMIGRLSNEGVEIEVQNIFKKIHSILKKNYPTFIKDIEWYYQQNNNTKYKQ